MRPAELTHWKTTCQGGGCFQLAKCMFLPFTKYYPHQEAFISYCLGKRFFEFWDFLPSFCKEFRIFMVPSFHLRRLSTQLFFFLLFQCFFTIEFLPVECATPITTTATPFKLKLPWKYWKSIEAVYLCVSEFSTPALSFDHQTVCRRGGEQKAVPIGRLKELHCFFITFIAC